MNETGLVFDTEGEGRWFDLDNGAKIKLRIMTADINKEIRKKTVKKKVDFKKVDGVAARFPYEEIDEDLQNELFWDYVIVDWENFFDKNRKPIPCTKENKLLLIAKSTRFVGLLNEHLNQLVEYEQEAAEEEEKN